MEYRLERGDLTSFDDDPTSFSNDFTHISFNDYPTNDHLVSPTQETTFETQLLADLTLSSKSYPRTPNVSTHGENDHLFENVSLEPSQSIENSNKGTSLFAGFRQKENPLPPQRRDFRIGSDPVVVPVRSFSTGLSGSNVEEPRFSTSDAVGPFYSLNEVLNEPQAPQPKGSKLAKILPLPSKDKPVQSRIGSIKNTGAPKRTSSLRRMTSGSEGSSIAFGNRLESSNSRSFEGGIPEKGPSGGLTRRMSARSTASSLFSFGRSSVVTHPLDANVSKTRPRMLPPKDPDEEKRHIKEYETMMKKAVQTEEKKKKLWTKRKEERDRHFLQSVGVWENEVLPNWNTKRIDKKIHELWIIGIPPRCRGKVWSLCIGNGLGLSRSSYEMYLTRDGRQIQDSNNDPPTPAESIIAESIAPISPIREVAYLDAAGPPHFSTSYLTYQYTHPSEMDETERAMSEDILRTLPSLCVFQPTGPLYTSLLRVLQAYYAYRTDIDYVHGTSFIAGMLMLNLEPPDAFVALANLISGSQVLRSIWSLDTPKIHGYFKVFNVMFAESLPKLYVHFKALSITNEHYLPLWFTTLYTAILPLELSTRLWDIYFLQGEIVLFRAGVALLEYLEPFLWASEFSSVVEVLQSGFVGQKEGEEIREWIVNEERFFEEVTGGKTTGGVGGISEVRWKELVNLHVFGITPQDDVKEKLNGDEWKKVLNSFGST